MATRNGENLLYKDLTYQIRGACFEVWKEFGGAFREKVVDRALSEELKSRGLKVENQKTISISYKGKKIASYIPDKIVNGLILLEIKCKPFLTKEDERQFWYYLKGSDYKIGLLINFGSGKLEIKRRIYDKARQKQKAIRVNPRSYPLEAKRSASKSLGFTFLETMVAILVLTIGIVIVLQIFPLAFNIEKSNQMETQGIFLCQEKIEELNSKSYADIQTGVQIESPLQSPFEKFSRETTINFVDANLATTTTETGLKRIEVKVSWKSPLRVKENSLKITSLIAEK